MRLVAWHAAEPVRAVVLARNERRFDEFYGTDTWGTRPRDNSIRGDSVGYGAIQPDRFTRLLAHLPAAPAGLTFVDLGCGKGKALVLAAEAGFNKCIGVELNPELAAVARNNLAVRAIEGEVVEGDAGDFVFPDEPLLVFLFNPFGADTLGVVLEALRRSVAASPRTLFVGYVNPIHRALMEASNFLVAIAEGEHWVLLRAVQP